MSSPIYEPRLVDSQIKSTSGGDITQIRGGTDTSRSLVDSGHSATRQAPSYDNIQSSTSGSGFNQTQYGAGNSSQTSGQRSSESYQSSNYQTGGGSTSYQQGPSYGNTTQSSFVSQPYGRQSNQYQQSGQQGQLGGSQQGQGGQQGGSQQSNSQQGGQQGQGGYDASRFQGSSYRRTGGN